MTTPEPLNIEEYESLAELHLGVSDWGSDWNCRQSLVGSARSIQELCKEIRHLREALDKE